DDQHGCSCFESHTALDADDRVSHMNVAPDAERISNFLKMLNGFRRVRESFAIDGPRLSLFKPDGNLFRVFPGHLRGPCLFREHTHGIECFPASDRSSPEA